MLFKIIVCLVLAIWARKSRRAFWPALVYTLLTWWSGSMYRVAGGEVNMLLQVLSGAALSYVAFWLTAKILNDWLGVLMVLGVAVLLYLYPFSVKPLFGGKWVQTSSGKNVYLTEKTMKRIDEALGKK